MGWTSLIGPAMGLAGQLLSKRPSTTQTTTVKLPDNQQRNVNLLMQGAEDLYKQGGPKYYEGETVAPRSADTLAGMDMARQFATGQGQDIASQAIAANSAWLNPGMMTNPSMIPGYDAFAGDLARRARISLTEDMLPSIRSSGVLAGGYGDSKNQIGQGIAVSRANDALQGQLGDLALNSWSRAASLQQQAIQMAPALMSLGLQPAQIMQILGSQDEAYKQRIIDAAMAKWNFEQQRPYANLSFLKDMTGRAGEYGGTTTTNAQGPSTGLTGMMQGLGAGGYIASLFGGQPGGMNFNTSMTPNMGTGAFGLPTGAFGMPNNSFGQNQVDWGRVLTPNLNPMVGGR